METKEIKRIEWFTLSQHGLYKKGYCKTIKGARRGCDKADNSYGSYLRHEFIVYYTDGSFEKKLFI